MAYTYKFTTNWLGLSAPVKKKKQPKKQESKDKQNKFKKIFGENK